MDALPIMFVSRANIGTASLRERKWIASTMTFEEWIIELKAETTWTRFREPVTEFTRPRTGYHFNIAEITEAKRNFD